MELTIDQALQRGGASSEFKELNAYTDIAGST